MNPLLTSVDDLITERAALRQTVLDQGATAREAKLREVLGEARDCLAGDGPSGARAVQATRNRIDAALIDVARPTSPAGATATCPCQRPDNVGAEPG